MLNCIHTPCVKDALPEFFTDVNQMYDALLNKSGATGVFTDFPDTGVAFLKKTQIMYELNMWIKQI